VVNQRRVSTLKKGDVFRDWLVSLLGDRIKNKMCEVAVYKISPASHTVCRYDFLGEDFGVIAKFFAEPQGRDKRYNADKAMNNEYQILRKVEKLIDIPRPIAIKREFSCVLVTEYIRGKSLEEYMESERNLYDRLTSVAHLLRRLHRGTKSEYRKEIEFAHFHKILDQLELESSLRETYNRLLGEWWYSSLLDQEWGCMVHDDATPVNYVFRNGRPYALDMESSWDHANKLHDLGVMAAELKNHFALSKGNGYRAEPYIGHFLWHYSEGEDEFRAITRAQPFFMALGLLRIARLHQIPGHRAYFFREAQACLRSKHLKEQRT